MIFGLIMVFFIWLFAEEILVYFWGGRPEEAQEELRWRLGPGRLVGAVLEESKAGSVEGAGQRYAWDLSDQVGDIRFTNSFC